MTDGASGRRLADEPAVCTLCGILASAAPLGLIATGQGSCTCRRCAELAWAVGWDSKPRCTTAGARIAVDEDPESTCHQCACRPNEVGGRLIGTPDMHLCRGDIEQLVRIFDDMARYARFGLHGSYVDGKRID